MNVPFFGTKIFKNELLYCNFPQKNCEFENVNKEHVVFSLKNMELLIFLPNMGDYFTCSSLVRW